MERTVSAEIDTYISARTKLEFQIGVAQRAGLDIAEELTFVLDGKPLEPQVIPVAEGGRIHSLWVDGGQLLVSYHATVTGQGDPLQVSDLDTSIYRRASRYAESDKFLNYAATQFDQSTPAEELVPEVAAWVGTQLSYIPGSSEPTDGAADTLLERAGVCRDYTHLVVALLRALNIPARLVAVYAPGCSPMDFHAVAEAAVDGVWRVVDATCLAPRQTMLRISTGRDAADTAFLTNYGGSLILNSSIVTAAVAGELPQDDVTELVSIR